MSVTKKLDHLKLCGAGIGHDAAGYATAQGLRNVLLISATPYQWKHIIGQRICRRNTDETRIVLLKIWQELYRLSPPLFSPQLTGAFCQRDKCLEGRWGVKESWEPAWSLWRFWRQIIRRFLGKRRMKIKLIDFGAEESWLPYRPHGNDAGADVYMPYGCTLKPGDVEKVPLGFGIEVPDG